MEEEKIQPKTEGEKELNPEQQGQEEVSPPAEPDANELKVQLDELKDRYLRVLAEMENMKKRQQRQYEEVIKYGKESILKDFLLVYDAIEKSIASAKDLYPDDEHFITGLQMIEKLLLETLKKHKVEPIETTNVIFDPNFHEAFMQVKRDDLEPGMVADEIEKGFLLHSRVLRPAKVTVSYRE
jgi:molecular chaperone GrpE